VPRSIRESRRPLHMNKNSSHRAVPVTGPRTEDGIVIGNVTNKGSQTGWIARRLVGTFDQRLLTAVRQAHPSSIHEVGCGEGRLSRLLRSATPVPILASDFSTQLIAENRARSDAGIEYLRRSIYELDPSIDSRDLVVCCEVLEHVERPAEALRALARLKPRAVILSVPREPIWRLLNVVRGKYLREFGNTPGHLNHWSPRSFERLLETHGFSVKERLNPFPWIMVSGSFVR
jgi:2-polyprenyl-3-methyl-5-hydroxy-6-metoxy-1,4-benzoquinol methylase